MNIKKAAGDVKYEIDMFKFTANELSNPCLPNGIKYALLESFAIHTRNLFFFFYTGVKARKKDDVLAEDYAINKKEFREHRTKKRLLNNIPKRVAKLIAHLTYHRAVYNKRTRLWKYEAIRKKLDRTINAFMNSLSDEQKIWF